MSHCNGRETEMMQRELVRLLKSLGQLTHGQRQKVMAELGTGERQAASVAIVEGSVSVKPSCPALRR